MPEGVYGKQKREITKKKIHFIFGLRLLHSFSNDFLKEIKSSINKYKDSSLLVSCMCHMGFIAAKTRSIKSSKI